MIRDNSLRASRFFTGKAIITVRKLEESKAAARRQLPLPFQRLAGKPSPSDCFAIALI